MSEEQILEPLKSYGDSVELREEDGTTHSDIGQLNPIDYQQATFELVEQPLNPLKSLNDADKVEWVNRLAGEVWWDSVSNRYKTAITTPYRTVEKAKFLSTLNKDDMSEDDKKDILGMGLNYVLLENGKTAGSNERFVELMNMFSLEEKYVSPRPFVGVKVLLSIDANIVDGSNNSAETPYGSLTIASKISLNCNTLDKNIQNAKKVFLFYDDAVKKSNYDLSGVDLLAESKRLEGFFSVVKEILFRNGFSFDGSRSSQEAVEIGLTDNYLFDYISYFKDGKNHVMTRGLFLLMNCGILAQGTWEERKSLLSDPQLVTEMVSRNYPLSNSSRTLYFVYRLYDINAVIIERTPWEAFVQEFVFPEVVINKFGPETALYDKAKRIQNMIMKVAKLDADVITSEALSLIEQTEAIQELKKQIAESREPLQDFVNYPPFEDMRSLTYHCRDYQEAYNTILHRVDLRSLALAAVWCIAKKSGAPDQAIELAKKAYAYVMDDPGGAAKRNVAKTQNDSFEKFAKRHFSSLLPTHLYPESITVIDYIKTIFDSTEKVLLIAVAALIYAGVKQVLDSALEYCDENDEDVGNEKLGDVASGKPESQADTTEKQQNMLNDLADLFGKSKSEIKLEDINGFVKEVSALLTSSELCSLFSGRASDKVLLLCVELLNNRTRTFLNDALKTTSQMENFFVFLGKRVEIDVCALYDSSAEAAGDAEAPLEPEDQLICSNGLMQLRTNLLERKGGMTPQEIRDQLAKEEERKRKIMEDLLAYANDPDGILNGLDKMMSCSEGGGNSYKSHGTVDLMMDKTLEVVFNGVYSAFNDDINAYPPMVTRWHVAKSNEADALISSMDLSAAEKELSEEEKVKLLKERDDERKHFLEIEKKLMKEESGGAELPADSGNIMITKVAANLKTSFSNSKVTRKKDDKGIYYALGAAPEEAFADTEVVYRPSGRSALDILAPLPEYSVLEDKFASYFPASDDPKIKDVFHPGILSNIIEHMYSLAGSDENVLFGKLGEYTNLELLDFSPEATDEQKLCDLHPHILDLDGLKRYAKDAFSSSCEEEEPPLEEILGLGKKKLNTTEQAIAEMCALLMVRVFLVEEYLKCMFFISQFDSSNSMGRLFFDYVASKMVAELRKKYKDSFYSKFHDMMISAYDNVLVKAANDEGGLAGNLSGRYYLNMLAGPIMHTPDTEGYLDGFEKIVAVVQSQWAVITRQMSLVINNKILEDSFYDILLQQPRIYESTNDVYGITTAKIGLLGRTLEYGECPLGQLKFERMVKIKRQNDEITKPIDEFCAMLKDNVFESHLQVRLVYRFSNERRDPDHGERTENGTVWLDKWLSETRISEEVLNDTENLKSNLLEMSENMRNSIKTSGNVIDVFDKAFAVGDFVALVSIHMAKQVENKYDAKDIFAATKSTLRSMFQTIVDGAGSYKYEDPKVKLAGGASGMMQQYQNSVGGIGGDDMPDSANIKKMIEMSEKVTMKMMAKQYDPCMKIAIPMVDEARANGEDMTLKEAVFMHVRPYNVFPSLGGMNTGGPPITSIGFKYMRNPVVLPIDKKKKRELLRPLQPGEKSSSALIRSVECTEGSGNNNG